MKMSQLMEFASYVGGLGFAYHILKSGNLPSKQTIADCDPSAWDRFYDYCRSTYAWEEEDQLQDLTVLPDGDRSTTFILYLKANITVCNLNSRSAKLLYDASSDPAVLEDLTERFQRLVPSKSKNSMGLIRAGMGGGLQVKTFNFTSPKQSIIQYLDEGTRVFYRGMVRDLRERQGNGLFLIYGKPGTGKTSFIKEVLGEIPKEALFISPSFTKDLTSPALISLLMEYPESILVIEDAESVIMERQADNSSAVSNLLNLTDGFLADFLNMKIICTFNTQLTNIDEALLRNGRLKGMHEFTEVDPARAAAIGRALGMEVNPVEPMTIADICESGIQREGYRSKSIGFG